MSETHVTAHTLQRLQRQELAPAELLDVVRHLGGCSACARTADAWVPSRLALDEEPGSEAEHLDPETQLFPWVDGTLDAAGREIVETHLEDCASCRAEGEDLRRLRRSAPRPRFVQRWGSVAAALVVVAAGAVLMSRRPPAPEAPPPTRTVPRAAATPAYANPEWSALVADAVRTRRLPTAGGLEALRPAADPLRGGGSGDVGSLSPAGVVVGTARPRFRWVAPDGKATYVVSVYDGSAEVATSGALTATEWTPPSDLPAERTLAWQVEVTGVAQPFVMPAPPAPPALFRVAPAADRAQIEAALARFPNDHLLHAVLYARAGLVAEAEAALQRAVAAGDRRAGNIAHAK